MVSRIPTTLLLVVLMSSARSPGQEQSQPEAQAKPAGGAKIYTAYNLWYEKPENISCVNYRRGVMIPAGTELASIELGSRRGKPLISFTTSQGQGRYVIHFRKKFHPGLTPEEFMRRMVTNESFEELTKGFSEKEIDAIKKGKLIVGMGKKAVLTCRGYPPEHRTPSLDANQWLYWDNRFRTKYVHFDDNGRTIRPPFDEDDF
ncbi:MAG: hypothetical protein ACE5HE_00090 [Phycisphaerae bacterium]